MPLSEPLLETRGLTKVFRRRFFGSGSKHLVAVDNLELTVHRGDVFGFLGPNGAGKSTTIRMALGLIHPTQGSVRIAGRDLADGTRAALAKVGAFVERPAFYPYLTGRKNLEIFAGLSGGVPVRELDEALDRVGLSKRADDKVAVYSHGMKQRLGIAACLMPRPELMILDEPTDGLDPHGIREVRELLLSLARDDGLTVFLSSHFLGEVENLCNRIAIMDHGQTILQGALDELEREHRRLRVETDRPAEAAELLRGKLGLEPRLVDGQRPALFFALKGARAEDVNALLVQAGFAVRALTPEPAWLERIFLERTTSKESNVARKAEA